METPTELIASKTGELAGLHDRFSLHWFGQSIRYNAKGSNFGLLVEKALRNKVQELDIGVPVRDGEDFYLPAGVESLRVLKLKLQGGTPKLYDLVFTSLETLSLSSLSFPGLVFDGRSVPSLEFTEWMSYSCRSLKVLNLDDIDGSGNLDISIPSLKVLTVSSCCVDSISTHCSSLETLEISKCSFYNLHLDVNAPCLKDLQIFNCQVIGYFDIRISAEQLQTLSSILEITFCVNKYTEKSLRRRGIYSDNLLSLSRATINLVVPFSTFGIADHTYNKFNSTGLVNCIYSVRYAKVLHLNFEIIQALSIQVQRENITFEHLKHLEHLKVSVVDLSGLNGINNITATAKFLGCCSRLKTIIFRCYNNADELSETEVLNRLCSEIGKIGVECGNIRITCD